MILKFLTTSLLFAISTTTFAVTQADQQSAKIESVLDKLESRYLDRESTPLTYDEQRAKDMGQTPNQPKETVTVKPREPITGQTPNQKMLGEIQRKINELETQIDVLEADSRKMKSEVIESSSVDNMVTIEVRLKNEKRAGLQNLTAKVDGSLMVNQVDPAGIWIPASLISVYQGPMQPGTHTVEINAVLTKTNSAGLAVAGWTPQQVQKSFEINLAPGRMRKSVVIELDAGSSQSGRAIAELIETSSSTPEKGAE